LVDISGLALHLKHLSSIDGLQRRCIKPTLFAFIDQCESRPWVPYKVLDSKKMLQDGPTWTSALVASSLDGSTWTDAHRTHTCLSHTNTPPCCNASIKGVSLFPFFLFDPVHKHF